MYVLSMVEKNVFTRYFDTYNNIYISDIVGKCNRLDKCGYHYTPHQYFTDNPWKRDTPRKEDCLFVRLHRENEQTNNKLPPEPKTDNPWKRDTPPREDGSRHCSPVLYHRVRERENREHPLALPPEPITTTNYPFLPNTPTNGGCVFGGGVVLLQHEKYIRNISTSFC